MKKRNKIKKNLTLDPALVAQAEKLVDGTEVRSLSHLIEIALRAMLERPRRN